MRRAALLAIPILLVFWSCSENSLFLGTVEEPAQVEVRALSSGAIVEPGTEVPISIVRDPVYVGDEATLDRLVVQLHDHEGTVLAEQAYESVDHAVDLPPVELPELAFGLYRMRTAYYDGTELVVEQTVPFFVASGTFRIVGLTSYPASSYPQADGLLRVSLDIPPAADPFIVWWINDEVVESGPLSETGSTIAVLAPEAQGVFPVRVDLYPLMPEDVDFRTVEAPATYAAELYVSESPAPARTDLVPAESYFALYHLRGSLRDEGARAAWFPSRDFAAIPFGAPELTVRSDLFGYGLDGSSGFRVAGAVWPTYRGVLSPVSISFRLLPDALAAESVLMSTSLHTTELASVLLDGTGRVGLRLGGLDGTLWSSLPLVRVGAPDTITVNVVPGAESGRVSFYSGGRLVSTADVPGFVLSVEDAGLVPGAEQWSLVEGSTVIGAETDGFVGVIDEFGVFFRDSENQPAANTALYYHSMRSTYGDRLVFAASFESDDERMSLEFDGGVSVSDGGVSVSDGALVLAPAATVAFPGFAFEDEDLVVLVDLVAYAAAEVRVSDVVTGEPVFVMQLDADGTARSLQLTLSHADGALTVASGERELAAIATPEFDGVRLEITAAEADGVEMVEAVRIENILAVRDRLRIPSRLFQVSGE